MRTLVRASLLSLLLPLAACVGISDQQNPITEDPGDDRPELECPEVGAVGDITVAFDCTEIDVDSCKDLSNVVLEFADGTQQRFEGLGGTAGTFAGTGENAGKEITTAWIKSGSNDSGDGAGFGERFDAPEGACGDDADDGDDGDDHDDGDDGDDHDDGDDSDDHDDSDDGDGGCDGSDEDPIDEPIID
jgi:hypothetical protein